MDSKEEVVLLANIGTSDIEINLEGYGYIPVWERLQPNQAGDYHKLDQRAIEIWDKRRHLIAEKLCKELDVELNDQNQFDFTDLTKKIEEAYKQYPEIWKERIYASRLVGLIQQVQEKFTIEKVILIVSCQNPLFSSDTIYLFKILEKWFKQKYDIPLTAEYIPDSIKLNRDQDALFEYYYKLLQSLDRNLTIILSLKGGTPIMQTALRTQSNLASVARPMLLIDTELFINNVLSGQPSPAYFTSYLKYTKIQKYQVINQLLELWDFNGAIKIFEDWKKYIDKLSNKGIFDKDIQNTKKLVDVLIKALEIGLSYFNLDSSGDFRHRIKRTDQLDNLVQIKQNYDCVLNLYTQCRIYWEINQVANFLSRMTSFYEEVLQELIRKLNSNNFLEYKKNEWILDIRNINTDRERDFWNTFYEVARNNDPNFRYHNFKRNPKFKLANRFIKLFFVDSLIKQRNNAEEIQSWEVITASLKKLDYWAKQRNKLIHSAEGVSKTNMVKIHNNDINNPEKKENDAVNYSCKRDEILIEMTQIIYQMREVLNLPESSYIGLDKRYYIYSDVRDKITNKLETEG